MTKAGNSGGVKKQTIEGMRQKADRCLRSGALLLQQATAQLPAKKQKQLLFVFVLLAVGWSVALLYQTIWGGHRIMLSRTSISVAPIYAPIIKRSTDAVPPETLRQRLDSLLKRALSGGKIDTAHGALQQPQ